MLTMVCGCNQGNIFYTYTKLHDHSSNRKCDILCSAHALFLDVQVGGASPIIFLKKIMFLFVLMGTFK